MTLFERFLIAAYFVIWTGTAIASCWDGWYCNDTPVIVIPLEPEHTTERN